MYVKNAHLIIGSLTAAGAFLLVCVCIRPAGWSANDGLSYYGSFLNTLLPYTLAFGSVAASYWLVAGRLQPEQPVPRNLQFALRAMAMLILALVIVPHTFNDPVHITFGSTLFILQLITALYLSAAVQWRRPVVAGLLTLLVSGLAALYYVPGRYGLLLQAQVVFQLTFGLTLAYALNVLSPGLGGVNKP